MFTCPVCNTQLYTPQIQKCPNAINHPDGSAYLVAPVEIVIKEEVDTQEKSIFASRTLWINVAIVLATIFHENLPGDSESYMLLGAVLNIVNRFFTSKAVTIKL